jgi:hypothetical protein
VPDPDAAVCLLWHDLHTALGGNDWAIGEWQTVESPSVLLFYERRADQGNVDFDERFARFRRETVAANDFVDQTFGLEPDTPPNVGGRSKAGNPPADFERQLRDYLTSRVEAVMRRERSVPEQLERVARPPGSPIERSSQWPSGMPARFGELHQELFVEKSIDTNAPRRVEPPRDAASEAHFAAFAPEAVEPGRSFLLEIWACRRGAYESMLKKAMRREGVSVRGTKLVEAPPVGTVFDVAVNLPSFAAAETNDTMAWTGEPASASFVMTPAADIRPGWHVGTATISLSGGVPFARLHFEIQVGPALDVARDLPSREHRVSTIFASYAGTDRIDVLQWARGAQVAGVRVFLDVLSLRESADWERELFNVVPTSDLFCLFWSASAKASLWVDREWRCALTARGLDYIHPVPLEDPREVAPPAELASRHFGDVTFLVQQYEKLRRQRERPSGSESPE